MSHRYVLRAAKHINKDTLRLLTVLGMVMAVCAAVMSFLGALLMFRQLRLISAQRKALPVIQRAAQLYLDQNAPAETPAQRRRKFFRFPRVKKEPVVVEVEEEAVEAAEAEE